MRSITVAPPNSLVFIHGTIDWETPLVSPKEGLVWSTASCIATACFPEQDGPTEIFLGDALDVIPPGELVFDGTLDTSELKVAITTVGSEKPILEYPVSDRFNRIRIWHSHPRWPDVVRIGIG